MSGATVPPGDTAGACAELVGIERLGAFHLERYETTTLFNHASSSK